MERWISRLLGLQEGLLGNITEWRIDFAVHGLVVAVLAALCAVAIVWIYRRENGPPPRRLRALLVTLRCVAVVLVLVLLFEPILAVEKREDKRPTVIFLVDDSMSMTVRGTEYADPDKRLAVMRVLEGRPDLVAGAVAPEMESRLRETTRYVAARAILSSPTLDWIGRLRKTHRLRFFTTTGPRAVGELDAERETPLAWPDAAEGRSTRLGDALREVVQGSRGQYVAGVVVLSDGQSNAGEDPVAVARFAASRRPDPIPFFCIGVGSDEPQRDVEVVEVRAPPDVLKSEQPFEIKVMLRSTGFAGSRTRVALYRGDTLVGEPRAVTLTDALGGQVEVFEDVPGEVGVFAYTARLEDVPEGDLIAENNAAAQSVRVTDQKFRVLYVEGWPRLEYHRLEALLDRNDAIYEYSVLLLSADLQWAQPANPPEKRLSGFPTSDRELSDNYDLVIFGDVDPRHPFLPGDFDETIRKFVMEGGGAFVMIAGPFHSPQAYEETALASILPLKEYAREYLQTAIREPFSVKLNPLLDHPLVQISVAPDLNARLWEEQFRPHWHWHVDEVKPLARALLLHATHQTREGKPCPLMLLMQAGRGQSLFIGLDETWRWPRGIPEGDPYHPFNTFWNQAIKYLASDKLLRGGKSVLLRLDRAAYTVGERVIATAEIIDSALPGFGPEVQEVEVQVLSPDRVVRMFSLRREPGTMTFVGTLPVTQKGHHAIRLLPREGGEILAEATFDAKEYTAEFISAQMNRPLLTEAAVESGGAYVDWADLATLPDLLKSRTKQVTRPVMNRLMDAPIVFFLFCCAIVAEWIVRKRARLM